MQAASSRARSSTRVSWWAPTSYTCGDATQSRTRCAALQNLVRAREAGARIVDLGLIFDGTAGFADEFVAMKPASDGYLAMAMVNYILPERPAGRRLPAGPHHLRLSRGRRDRPAGTQRGRRLLRVGQCVGHAGARGRQEGRLSRRGRHPAVRHVSARWPQLFHRAAEAEGRRSRVHVRAGRREVRHQRRGRRAAGARLGRGRGTPSSCRATGFATADSTRPTASSFCWVRSPGVWAGRVRACSRRCSCRSWPLVFNDVAQ